MKAIDLSTVKNILAPRPEDMHKGQAGRVLIIAGQAGMAGAAVLSARGALYSGAGLVKIAAPVEIFAPIQTCAFEAMCIDRDQLARGEYDLSEFDVIAIGPGLGVSVDNVNLLESVLMGFEGPVVVDADGLNCLCKRPDMIKGRKADTILTPHPGEADRLLKATGNEGYKQLDRETAALKLTNAFSDEGDAIVLLKGKDTVVASPDDIYINTTGNPGMATGGSGDVLTGIIASFVAQGCHYMNAKALDAVIAAAYIHGAAGDIAAQEIGQYGMTSADIADAVSAAIKDVIGF